MSCLPATLVAEPDPSDLRRTASPRSAQGACVIWLTGLSGAGKSTLAEGLRARLLQSSFPVALLDGDEIRRGLSHGLGFSQEDRNENIRRIAEVARLLSAQGLLTVVAAISPRAGQRELARCIVGQPFREVYVDAPLALCEQRDVKGLYAQARRGEIARFTGVGDVYEVPQAPDLRIDTAHAGISEAVDLLTGMLFGRWTSGLRRAVHA